MIKSVYLKQLLELGLKKSQVTYIVGHSDIFKNIPKQQGYPVNYNFNMCVFTLIGCGLMQLGISFRHINEVLFELCDVDFEKEYIDGTDFYKKGVIYISFGDFSSSDVAKVKHNTLDGKIITLTKKRRTSALKILKTKDPFVSQDVVFIEGDSLFVSIRVKTILDKVYELFLEPDPF